MFIYLQIFTCFIEPNFLYTACFHLWAAQWFTTTLWLSVTSNHYYTGAHCDSGFQYTVEECIITLCSKKNSGFSLKTSFHFQLLLSCDIFRKSDVSLKMDLRQKILFVLYSRVAILLSCIFLCTCKGKGVHVHNLL